MILKDGSIIVAVVRGQTTYDEQKKRVMVHGILYDISERKRAEEDMKRQLMDFNLDDGMVYLAKEPLPALSVEAFMDLLKIGKNGFAISRTPESEFRRIVENQKMPGSRQSQELQFQFVWLAEDASGHSLPPVLRT